MTEVSRECWDEIMRELREGTPNTPERIALFERADRIYRQFANGGAGCGVNITACLHCGRLSYEHGAAPSPEDSGREALKYAESALRELNNLRWEDIWGRVDASGDGDDLARWSQKYMSYVREDLVKAIAALRAAPRAEPGEPSRPSDSP